MDSLMNVKRKETREKMQDAMDHVLTSVVTSQCRRHMRYLYMCKKLRAE